MTVRKTETETVPTLEQILAMPGRKMADVHAELPHAPRRATGTVDARYLSLRKQGIAIRASWGTVDCVWLYTKMERHDRYVGQMPWGIAFGMTSERMADLLGQPVGQSPETVDRLMGTMLARDMWDVEGWTVHAEYRDGEVVRLCILLAGGAT